jgi:hypothetical protein
LSLVARICLLTRQTSPESQNDDQYLNHLTTELVEKFGDRDTLPQSPSLIAEIASPADAAEDLFAKADEYLASGCREVWLVFPESHRLLIVTQAQTWAFNNPDEVGTQ